MVIVMKKMMNEKMNNVCKLIAVVLTFSMLLGGLMPSQESMAAKKKTSFKNSKETILIGKSMTLKLKNKIKGNKYTWKSSNKKIASVSKKGKVTGVNKGKTKISCTIKNSTKKSKTKKYTIKCNINVIKGAKKLVIYNGRQAITDLSLEIQETIQLTAVQSPASSNDVITWSSSDSNVATVDEKGKVDCVGLGKTNIIATSSSGMKSVLRLTVINGGPLPSTENDNAISILAAVQSNMSLGVAINTYQLNDPNTSKIVKSEFNSITMENEMNPDSLLNQSQSQKDSTGEPSINTSKLDVVLKAAKDNGIKLRGHTLVWHSQTPDWFFREGYKDTGAYVIKEVMLTRMENYIKNVITYCQDNYPGVIYCWDVVNEAVNHQSGGIRSEGSNWYKVIGEEFIEKAFVYARKYANPDVKLFYNDYDEYIPDKRDTIYEVCKSLKEKGLLDGIGMQSHWDLTGTKAIPRTTPFPCLKEVKETILKFASIPGVEIQLTEVDTHCNDNSVEGQKALANYYKVMFDMIFHLDQTGKANITGVTVWGLSDATTWLTGFKGETSYPVLFDANNKRKVCYNAILDSAKKYY